MDAGRLPDEVLADLQRRLRRVEGQVRGVGRMLDERRDCKDIVSQLSAASRALERTKVRLLAAGLRHCVEHPDDVDGDTSPVDEFERLLVESR